MALVTSLERDMVSMRQAIARLSSIKLGPTSTPKFADLTLTGDLTVGGNIDLTGTLTLSALTASRLIATNASKELVSSDLNNWIAGTANEISITDDGDGTVTIGIVDPLIVSKGGSGAATFTDHSLLVGSGTDAFTAIGAATNGQLPIGSTGNDPVLATLTAGAGLAISNGAGSITLAVDGPLEDLDTLGASTVDGEFLVATGAGVLAWESGATARTSMGVGTGDSPTFTGLDLIGITDGYVPYISVVGFAAAPIYTDGSKVNVGHTNLAATFCISKVGTEGFEFYPGVETRVSQITLYDRDETQYDSLQLRAYDYRWRKADGTHIVRITDGGNFGINTTTPDTKLQVVGDCKFGDDNTNYTSISTTGSITQTGSASATFGTLSATNFEATNKLTACATNAGALDFSAASKTLTVEDDATVSQDYSTDASPTFAGLTLSNASGGILFTVQSTSDATNLDNYIQANKYNTLWIDGYGTAAYASIACRRGRGTIASPTILSDNDEIAAYIGRGYDGSQFRNSAGIFITVDGAPTADTSVPGDIRFYTTPSGDNTWGTPRFIIQSDGDMTGSGSLSLTGSITASNYTAANLLTACATNAGALDFSAASKTLTVEDNAIVSQDYSSDGSPAFAGLEVRGSSVSGDLTLSNSSTVIVATNVLGSIIFKSYDISTNTEAYAADYAKIRLVALNDFSGSPGVDAALQFMIADSDEPGAGKPVTPVTAMAIKQGGTTCIGDGGTTNYATFASDGELTLTGTARVIRSRWINAGAIKAPGAKPATAIAHGTLETPAWQFGDEGVQANEETVSFNLKFPEDMDMSVAPSLCVGWSTTTTDPGDESEQVEWQLEYLYTQVNEATNAAAEETLYVTGTASETAEGLVVSEFTGMNVPNASDVCIHCRIKRLSSASAGSQTDTVADDVELHGIVFKYTSNKLGTAT